MEKRAERVFLWACDRLELNQTLGIILEKINEQVLKCNILFEFINKQYRLFRF